MSSRRAQDSSEPEELSTNFHDLSILSPHDQEPRSISQHGIGLLQDENMSLAGGFGEGDSILEGDDSFFGNNTEDATLKYSTTARSTRETDEQDRDDEGEDEERNTLRRSVRGNDGFEFGGSMAASTTTRSYDPTPPTATSSTQRTSGTKEEEREREQDGESEVDGDDDLCIEDDASEEDKQRIKQLRRERDELRMMNKVLRGVVTSLKRTQGNMDNLQAAANTSHELLDLYSRICSQAEHTKDLILDPDWKGLDADEDYLIARQEAVEAEQERMRREAEAEQERILQAEREREERKRREEEDAARRSKSAAGMTRGMGRGMGRGSVGNGVGGAGGRILVRGTRARPTTISTSTSTRGGRIPTATSTTNDTSYSFSSTSGSGIPTYNSGLSSAGRGSAAVSGVRGVRGLRSRGGVSGIGRGRGA
ncbi:hypothetical protein JCM16303_005526 [Sporobolomyces ruberrimus]